MPTTFKTLYGAGTSLTVTLASLAAAAYRQSTFVDNASNEFLTALCNGKIKTAAAGVSATGVVSLYAYASFDGGTTYTHGASGADAAYTPDLSTNLFPLTTIGANANATTYFWDFDICAAAGWVYLPQRWGLIVFNNTGQAFDATPGNFLTQFMGVNTQGTP
jgi:hypothetical protein